MSEDFTPITTAAGIAPPRKNDLDGVWARRKQYWANGYRPIEIWGPDQRADDKGEPLTKPGKQPRGLWRRGAAQNPPAVTQKTPDPRALNTGIACGESKIIGVDGDILDPILSEQITEMVVSVCGETPLVRVGLPPKTLLVYRAEKTFRKIQTPVFILPNGLEAHLEVLAEGQQFVADGIHPDTRRPYHWAGESPETVHVSLLPVITEDQAREVVRRAEQILRDAGAVPKKPESPPHPKAKPNGHDKANGHGGSFFNMVNDAALADIGSWAEALFPRAVFASSTGAWRVSSKDLGRDLEEDISIHPDGVQDFGEEVGQTPIDLVMRHGDIGTPVEAARWLCDRLGIEPAALGYAPSGEVRPLSDKITKLIKSGDAAAYNGDRSAAVFAVACAMVRAGHGDDAIAATLTDPANRISDYVREQGEGHALRQAQQARATTAADWVRSVTTGAIDAGSLPNLKKALCLLGFAARYNEFSGRSYIAFDGGAEQLLDDAAADKLWIRINEACGWRPDLTLFYKMINVAARDNGFHPVREYLDGLKWDGEKRINTWLFDYGGAPKRPNDTDYDKYVRAVGRIVLLAAVRRVRQPGVKFDEMVVLINETQGTEKSEALLVLARQAEWFTDSIDLGADPKQTIEQTVGKWIMEIPELKGQRRNSVDHVKAFLSRQRDSARLAYGHFPTEVPRQFVCIGTTNDTKFLVDKTGNRRFWPVFGIKFDIEKLKADCDQLWAEAAMAEAQGESIRLAPELWAIAEGVQKEALVEEPWVEFIEEALGSFEGKIRGLDIWKILDINPKEAGQAQLERRGYAMKKLGWDRKQGRFGRDPETGYFKGATERRICVTRDYTTRKCWAYQGNVVRDVSEPSAMVERTWKGVVTERDLLAGQGVEPALDDDCPF